MTTQTSTLDVSNNVGCGCAACMRTGTDPTYMGDGDMAIAFGM